jgi:hypothetical protein
VDMSRLDSLSAVRPLFRRPNGRSASEDYSKPVILEHEFTSGHYDDFAEDPLKLRAFMAAHYEKELRPLIIGAANSHEYTSLRAPNGASNFPQPDFWPGIASDCPVTRTEQ